MPRLHIGKSYERAFRKDLIPSGIQRSHAPRKLIVQWGINNTGTIGSRASILTGATSDDVIDEAPDMAVRWEWSSLTIDGHPSDLVVRMFVDSTTWRLMVDVVLSVVGEVDLTWSQPPGTDWNWLANDIGTGFTTTSPTKWHVVNTSFPSIRLSAKTWH